MGKVSAARRKRMPGSAFAYPKARKYLIHDATHRRLALAMAGRSNTYGTKLGVQRAINRKLGKGKR